MTVRAEDLPPEVRKRLGLDAPKMSKKSRAGVGLSVPCAGHCGCGEAFPTAARWERHAAETGHTRWNIDLTQGAK